MCQPCNGIGFAAACRVLNQVIFLAVVFYDIFHQLAHGIKLMITGENQRFLGHTLTGIRVFLGLLLQEYNFINQIQHCIFFEDIFPHIRNIDAVFVVGVALAGVNPNAAAFVERQKERRFSFQIGAHIDFVQVHGKVSQTARLKFQQTGFVIPLELILTDRILIILSAGVAFQLKGENGNAVEEDYKVNALTLFVPDFLHHRENILLIQRLRFLVEGGGGLAVHEGQGYPVIKLHTVLQHIQQAAAFLIDLIVDVVEDGLAGPVAIEFFQSGQCIRLGSLQKGEQQLHIHAVAGIVSCRGTDLIAVFLPQHFQNVCLIICPFL